MLVALQVDNTDAWRNKYPKAISFTSANTLCFDNMLLNEINVARCPSHQCKASEKPAIVSNLRQNF